MPLYTQTRGNFFSAAQVAVAGGYQVESEAIFAAFTTPPTTGRKDLIDACVVSLKASGVWTLLDALYMFAAADSQAALINWKNPGTYNATLVNSPAFVADQGFTGASTKYVDSGFNPTTAVGPQFVQNSATILARSRTVLAQDSGFIGMASNAAGTQTLYPRSAGNLSYYFLNDVSADNESNSTSIGLFIATRTGAGAKELYLDAVSLGTSSGASSAPLNLDILFLRYDATYWTGQVASGGIGSKFSAADVTAFKSAELTYMQGVGAA